jgi:ribosomal protein S18 acetylase RimI-like enzyme
MRFPTPGKQVPPLSFRTATDPDIPALRALADVIWRECYPGIITAGQIDYMLDRMYAPEVIRSEMAEGVIWEFLLIADQPVGFVSCAHDQGRRRLKLHKLYVLPAFHGQGLGRQALESLRDRAVRLEAREIQLTVNKRNVKAITSYERAGFQITSAVVNDIGGGYVMDDYVMTWRFATA